jgi:ADP-L-glycero-D-manno-heptose 6-epimerase
LSRNNVGYYQQVQEWCVEANCPFYYASSAATYGDGCLGFDDRIPPAKLKPLNLDGKSKQDFDHWVLEEIEQGRPARPAWAGLKFFILPVPPV